MVKTKWAKLQLNRYTWTARLLSRKRCVITKGYSFWSNDKCSIQQLVSESRSWAQFLAGQLLRVRLLQVTGDINYPETKCVKSQSNRDTWTTTFLNRKSCILNKCYRFWSSGKIQYNKGNTY